LARAAIAVSAALIVINDENASYDSDGATFAGGAGTAADPYVISTYEQLNEDFRDQLALDGGAGLFFELGADIAMPATNWVPLPEFKGNLNGAGHSITGLVMNYTSDYAAGYDVGFFTIISGSVSDMNLSTGVIAFQNGVSSTDVPRSLRVGAVVGRLNGTLEGVNVTLGSMTVAFKNGTGLYPIGVENDYGQFFVGGIVGYSAPASVIKGCIEAGGAISVSYTSPSGSILTVNAYVGGLVGYFQGVITWSSSASDLTAKYVAWSGNPKVLVHVGIGGFMGYLGSNSTVEYCRSSGNVSTTGDNANGLPDVAAGGFVADGGNTTSRVGKSYSTGNVDVFTTTAAVAGATGSGSVGRYANAGGFVGQQTGTVFRDCYSRGSVNVKVYADVDKVHNNIVIGGFIGSLFMSGPTIYNSYSTARVVDYSTDGTYTVAVQYGVFTGLIGLSVSNSHYLDISGTSAKGTPNTETEMKDQSTFVGWDFADIWAIDPSLNDGYPTFKQAVVSISAVASPSTGGTLEEDSTGSYAAVAGSVVSVGPVSFRATPATGYVFSHWSDGARTLSYDPVVEVFAPGPTISLTAYFVPCYYVVISATAGGTVSYAISSGGDSGAVAAGTSKTIEVPVGKTVVLTAAHAPSHAFTGWTGSSTSADAVITGIDAAGTYTANFAALFHTVSASADSWSVVTPSGSVTVSLGGSVSFSFAANSGYVIADVVVDGASVPSAVASGAYTFSDVRSNHAINVTSKLAIPASGGDGSGNSGGSGSGNGSDGANDGNGDSRAGDAGKEGGVSVAAVLAIIVIAIALGSLILWLVLGRRRRRD
jgi:hypothetical protein